MTKQSRQIITVLFFLIAVASNASPPMLLQIDGIEIAVPIRECTVNTFLQRSILYEPIDVVRDGLPWFGTRRDDWRSGVRIRKHMGLDFYSDTIVVVAAGDGVVTAVGRGKQWGGSITIDHGDSIATMYLHISEWMTYIGAAVKRGDVIGEIFQPEGNAYQTQLHWSLLKNGKFIDPLPLIRRTHRDNKTIQTILQEFDRTKQNRLQRRDSLMSQ
ncbi:MAG: M23 family metallopeptidase [bacterium]|nr:M23 family metallopeptidase [bacterium]